MTSDSTTTTPGPKKSRTTESAFLPSPTQYTHSEFFPLLASLCRLREAFSPMQFLPYMTATEVLRRLSEKEDPSRCPLCSNPWAHCECPQEPKEEHDA
jgi:hypothetical protein